MAKHIAGSGPVIAAWRRLNFKKGPSKTLRKKVATYEGKLRRKKR